MSSPLLASLLRDMRVMRRWRRGRAAQHLGSRATAFAAAILARRGRSVVTLLGPERTARRLHALSTAVHHHHLGDSTRLALRFDIRMTPAMRARAQPAPFLPWIAAPAAAMTLPAPAAARLSLVQRIVARERRVETSMMMREERRAAVAQQREYAGAPALPPAAPWRARPVEMIVHRQRPPAPEAARAATPAAPQEAANERVVWPSVVRLPTVQAPAPLSAAELGRVTDHVVRAIDHRFLAQRERRGRI